MKFYKDGFKSMTKDGLAERSGYRFDYKLGDGTMTQLGVYKSDGSWVVIDLDCGMRVCDGATRKEAVGNAEGIRDKYTEMRGSEKYAKEVAAFDALMNPAAEVSLESMRKWCEGKGLKAKQVHPGSKDKIWVLGPSKPYRPELKEMGFRWGTSKKFGKGWYCEPTTA